MSELLVQLPALQVVVPLLAAPLCVLFGRRLAWLIVFAASLASTAISAALLSQVWDGSVISYAMGGWAPPWGIEYRVDLLNALILLIVSAMSSIVLVYALGSVRREIPVSRQALFYATFALCLTGLLGIAITGDAFNVFVFLEISSLSSYALISMGSHRKALTAAFQYLVMGTIGATFILIGVGLLYMMTGTLNMADLAQRLSGIEGTRPVTAAFGFLTVGIALKLALFPLHLWLPNAYAFAPSVVSAFLAATATKVSIYLLLRFAFSVFGASFSFVKEHLDWLLLGPAVLAMFAGSLSAIFQVDVKRMLAYSSVAQIGYIVLGIALATQAGVAAGLIHIFNHALIKAALFCALGCVFYRLGSVRLEHLAGLGRDMPWTMATFVVGGLSLIGVPLTAGFISKWYLIDAALDGGYWWLAVLIVVSSLLAVVYVWRVVEVMYFRPVPEGHEKVAEAPLLLLLPTLALTAANLYFGLATTLPVSAAQGAAQLLVATP